MSFGISFQGKFPALLDKLYHGDQIVFPPSCASLKDSASWEIIKDKFYKQEWCPYIKETFNGFGNAIEYLGKYTHKIAISNSRIISVNATEVTFSARGKKPGEPRRTITLSNEEFIRHYLMHALPSGFQKSRYYGFLNNRKKSENLKLLFELQGHQIFRRRCVDMSMAELLKAAWNLDISVCPTCGYHSMKQAGRTYDEKT